MAEFIQFQSDFSLGQLNQKLGASVENEVFYKGMRTVTNMVISIEAGLLKRFGLRFGLTVIDIEGNITVENSKWLIFQFSVTKKLIVVFSPKRINVLDEDAQGNISTVFSDTILYDSTQIPTLKFAQSRGVLLVFQEDLTFQRLAIPPGSSFPNFDFGKGAWFKIFWAVSLTIYTCYATYGVISWFEVLNTNGFGYVGRKIRRFFGL